MPEEALALGDLALVLLWLGAFILASLAYYIAAAIDQAINSFSLPLIGNPFGGIGKLIAGYIVKPLDGLRKGAEAKVAKGFHGLVYALEDALGLTLLLGVAVYALLKYLWKTALGEFVHTITNPIVKAVNAIAAAVTALTATVAKNLIRAERYADAAVTEATHEIESTLRTEIKAARNAADRYADEAVSALRKAENAALSAAVATLTAGITAAERIAEQEFHTAERDAAAALAQADAVIDSAIAGVKAIAVTAEDDLTTLLGKLSPADAAALIAAIPLIGALVTTIAVESGLDNASCRSKVKGICGTNPAAWENLLVGLAALGFAFNLRELAGVANGVVRELVPIIEQAA